MAVAINCSECDKEIQFHIPRKGTKKPTETCDNCGAVFQINVRKVE